jgi:putative intracellular protease/amidase
MTRIAVLIGKDFEDSEYTQPAEAFKKAGYELVHLGLNKGGTVTGKKQNTPVQIDKEVVVDGNLVTSRQPSDLPAFIKAGLKMLQSRHAKAA